MNLSKKEKRYLELIYRGVDDPIIISDTLKLQRNKVSTTKARIFKKLAVNSWFNAIRRSFTLDILLKEEYNIHGISDIVSNCSSNIHEIYNNREEGETEDEVKLKIYYALLNSFNEYEYDSLLRSFDGGDRDFK